MKKTPETDVELIQRIVRDALWNIHYHEHELIQAHKEQAAAKALLIRAELDFTVKDALDFYEEHDEENDFETVSDAIKYIIGTHLNAPTYHEDSLVEAHKRLAAVKAFVGRTNFTKEEIAWDEQLKGVIEKVTK